MKPTMYTFLGLMIIVLGFCTIETLADTEVSKIIDEKCDQFFL